MPTATYPSISMSIRIAVYWHRPRSLNQQLGNLGAVATVCCEEFAVDLVGADAHVAQRGQLGLRALALLLLHALLRLLHALLCLLHTLLRRLHARLRLLRGLLRLLHRLRNIPGAWHRWRLLLKPLLVLLLRRRLRCV